MTPNPATMTVQEAMDFAAVAKGYHFSMDREIGPIGWVDPDGVLCEDHPFRPTLDSAAAAMPERWCFSLERYETGYTISAHSWDMTKTVPTFEADTELLARWRLVVACMMAEKEVGDE